MTTSGMVSRDDISGALSASLGKQKADELVAEAFTALGLTGADVPKDRALAVLEHLAQSPGIVGVTARFAKSRMVLRW